MPTRRPRALLTGLFVSLGVAAVLVGCADVDAGMDRYEQASKGARGERPADDDGSTDGAGVEDGTANEGSPGAGASGEGMAEEGDEVAAGGTDPGSATSPTPPAPAPAPVPPGSFGAGTELLAITDLNVRSGEGTSFAVLTLIPAGARVKVVTTSGAGGWVNVDHGGTVGWASKTFLSTGKYSAARGQRMADRALALWNGKSSRNLCLAGVDDTAETSGAIPASPGWIPRKPSAVDWQNFVNANPEELLARGYVRANLDVNSLPKGAILGWRGGQCGYHSLYGHIEIVADAASSLACSDYCGAIKKNCGAPFVYIPIEL